MRNRSIDTEGTGKIFLRMKKYFISFSIAEESFSSFNSKWKKQPIGHEF